MSYFACAVIAVISGLIGVMVGLALAGQYPVLVRPPAGTEEPEQLSEATLVQIRDEAEWRSGVRPGRTFSMPTHPFPGEEAVETRPV